MDPRRPADHDRELGHRRADEAPNARHELDRDRPDRVDLPDRRDGRRTLLRAAVRQARPEAPPDHDVAPVPLRDWRGRLRHRPSHRLARLLLPDPVRGRGGHRRPVRRDQLGNRRDDAVQVQGTGRHLDQRHVLGRSDPRLLRLAHLPQRVRGQRRLAARLPDGPGARSRRDLRGPHAAREPTLADDARTHGGGGSQSPDDRGRRPKVGTGARARSTTPSRSSSSRKSSTATSHSSGSCSTRTRSERSSARH